MTRDEVISAVLARCGGQDGNSTLVTHAQTEIQIVQEQLEQQPELPWFCYAEDSVDTTASQSTLALPTGWLAPDEESPLFITNSDGDEVALNKDDFGALREKWLNADEALPEDFALLGTSGYRLFPTPDAAYTVRVLYYKAQTTLDSDVENNWLKYALKWVMGELGLIIAEQYLGDRNRAKAFARQAEIGRAEVLAKTIELKEAGVLRSMGDGP